MVFKSKSWIDTYELAKMIAKHVKGGDIILLNGDLGAGKTTFVKGFAASVGVIEPVTSPTFTLLKTYDAKNYTIVHVDAYRLDGSTFEELEDYISDENVIFIEWSDCLASQELIENHLSIDIKYVSKNQRTYTLTPCGSRYEELLKEIESYD